MQLVEFSVRAKASCTLPGAGSVLRPGSNTNTPLSSPALRSFSFTTTSIDPGCSGWVWWVLDTALCSSFRPLAWRRPWRGRGRQGKEQGAGGTLCFKLLPLFLFPEVPRPLPSQPSRSVLDLSDLPGFSPPPPSLSTSGSSLTYI